MGHLYVVGTPIGNLEDITFRALRTLKEVNLIAAEDTRTTGRLLKHFDITTPQVSFHDHSNDHKLNQLLDRLSNNETIALVTDAGMPGVSDPGYRLIRLAIDAGHKIEPIPGPTAAITALVTSGLPTDKFLFLGFLPKTQVARQTALKSAADHTYTLILYESPHRVAKLLADVATVLGNRRVVIAREITKLYEEIWRGNAQDAADHFANEPVRGEVTIIIEGASSETAVWDEARVKTELNALIAGGLPRKTAAKQLAEISGWRKNAIYQLEINNEK